MRDNDLAHAAAFCDHFVYTRREGLQFLIVRRTRIEDQQLYRIVNDEAARVCCRRAQLRIRFTFTLPETLSFREGVGLTRLREMWMVFLAYPRFFNVEARGSVVTLFDNTSRLMTRKNYRSESAPCVVVAYRARGEKSLC